MKPLVALGFLGAALTAAFLVGKRSATPPALPTPAICSAAGPRDIRSVLKEEIDVRDFGAKCDGPPSEEILRMALAAARSAGKRTFKGCFSTLSAD